MIIPDKSNSDEILVKYLIPRGLYCRWEGVGDEGVELCPLFECNLSDRCKGFDTPLDREDYVDYAGVRGSRVIKCERCVNEAKVGNSGILVSYGNDSNLSDGNWFGEVDRELEN